MADTPKKEHPKFRTFAQDFSAQQERRGTQPAPEVTEVVKKKPEAVPVAKAPSATTEHKSVFVKPVIKPVEPEKTSQPKLTDEKSPEPKKEPAVANIPSFHDLQEEVAAIHLSKKEKPVKKEAPVAFTGKKPVPSNTPRVNIGFDSKVITDRKHNRFKLFPSIKASLSSWFKTLIKPRKKKAPSYLVPEADRRKGVIQKATSQSGSVFSADSVELKEKIRQRQLRQEDEKKAEALAQREPETSWSPYTETGYDLLEEGEEMPVIDAPKNVTIEYKQQQTIEVDRWNPAEPVFEPEPTPVIEQEPEPVIDTPTEIVIPEPEIVSEEEVPTVVPDLENAIEPKVIIEPISVNPEENEVEIVDQRKSGINWRNTNTLTIVLLAVVVSAILVSLIVRLVMSAYQVPELVIYTDTTKPIAGAQLSSFVVTDNLSLLRQVEVNRAVSEFGYVDTQVYTPNGEVIPPARVLQLLEFNVLPSFSQSLTDVRFVYLNQSKPIIVFSFVDEETILGGFLAWEKNMFEDLQPIYNLPTDQTETFTDQTIGGIDVRVLLSDTGQTLVVYGMVNENTALISNSLDDFTQVTETSF